MFITVLTMLSLNHQLLYYGLNVDVDSIYFININCVATNYHRFRIFLLLFFFLFFLENLKSLKTKQVSMRSRWWCLAFLKMIIFFSFLNFIVINQFWFFTRLLFFVLFWRFFIHLLLFWIWGRVINVFEFFKI